MVGPQTQLINFSVGDLRVRTIAMHSHNWGIFYWCLYEDEETQG